MQREQFLRRVSRSLEAGMLPDVSAPGRVPEISFPDPVANFVAEAGAVDAEVGRVSQDQAVDSIERIFAAVGTTRYLAWDTLDEVVPFWDAWAVGSGLERIDTVVGTEPTARHDDHARVGSARIGITTADLGIAASGSVVLVHGPGRPRSASLLVGTHIVLLSADRIVSSLTEAMQRVSWEATSNVTVITGPSRTADIEAVLTLGVHGPRHLHILVVG